MERYLFISHLIKDSLEESQQFYLQSGNRFIPILSEDQIIELKNLCSSPMAFATKVLLRIFNKSELIGHCVAETLSLKRLQNKEALEEARINYIQWLVYTYYNCFDEEKQASIWLSCRKAINRVIRSIEDKETKLAIDSGEGHVVDTETDLNQIFAFGDSEVNVPSF